MNFLNLKNNKAKGTQGMQIVQKPQTGTRPVPRGSLPHQLSSDPFLDWVLILVIGVVAAIALVGTGISVYLADAEAMSMVEGLPVKTALPLDRAGLDEVLKSIDQLSERGKAITNSYSAPRDPLLP